MDSQKKKVQQRKLRTARVRAKISGTKKRPRLAVFRSLKHISVQAIDDLAGKTLASASDKEVKGKTLVAKAELVGQTISKKLIAQKITSVVFDKRHYRYHGAVKALADGARTGGLKF